MCFVPNACCMLVLVAVIFLILKEQKIPIIYRPNKTFFALELPLRGSQNILSILTPLYLGMGLGLCTYYFYIYILYILYSLRNEYAVIFNVNVSKLNKKHYSPNSDVSIFCLLFLEKYFLFIVTMRRTYVSSQDYSYLRRENLHILFLCYTR